MRTRLHLLAPAILALALTPSMSRADQLVPGNFNLIVTGNYTSSNHVQGRSLIVGGLNASGGPEFAQNYQGSNANDTLIVGGAITGGNAKVDAGYAAVFNGHSFGTNSGVSFQGGSQGYETNAATLANDSGYLQSASGTLGSLSNTYAGFSAGSNAFVVSGNQANFNVNSLANNGVATFNVTASALTNPGIAQYNLNLNGSSPSTIVINVSDPTNAAITFGGGANFVGSFQSLNSRVIFNFQGTETVTTGGAFYGSILGPNISLVQGGSNIYGGVYVANFIQNAELHTPQDIGTGAGFVGVQPVPEPASIALVALGLPVAIAVARRRRKPIAA